MTPMGVNVGMRCDPCDVRVEIDAVAVVVINAPVLDEYRLIAHCPHCKGEVDAQPSEKQARVILDGGAHLALPAPREPA